MTIQNWDDMAEVTDRLLARDKTHIDALRLNIHKSLVSDADIDKATEDTRLLVDSVLKTEPKNHKLM